MKEMKKLKILHLYGLFQPESRTDEFIILNFENRGHYNLININTNNNKILSYEKNKKEIKEKMIHFPIKIKLKELIVILILMMKIRMFLIL